MCVRALEGHTFRVRALAPFPPRDGRPARLLSGSWDQTVIVWRADGPPAGWHMECRLGGHDGNVVSVCACACPAGRPWVVCAAGRTVRVWDLSEDAGAGARDGAPAEAAGAVGAEAVPAATGRALRGHFDRLTGVAASGGLVFSSGMDRTVRVWRAGTWEALGVFPAAGGYPDGAGEGYSPVHALALLAAGGRVAAGCVAGQDGSELDFRTARREVTVWRVLPAGAAGTGLPGPEWREWAAKQGREAGADGADAGAGGVELGVEGQLRAGTRDVMTLLAAAGRLWGGLGKEVVVWGSAPPPPPAGGAGAG